MGELLDYLVQNEQGFRQARLPALYSDFQAQRTLNPDGYAANVNAWKRGLSNAALAGKTPSKSASANHVTLEIDDDALLRSLETKQFGRPLALGVVLREAMASKEMIPLQQYMRAAQSIYHRSWGSLPWAVAGWALKQVGLTGGGLGGGGSIPKGQVVVVVQNLEILAKAFADATAETATSPFERIFSRTHFQRTFERHLLSLAQSHLQQEQQKGIQQQQQQQQQKLSEQDMDILIKFLSRDKGLITTDGQTIKVLDPSESISTSTTAMSISQEDSAIASLKELTESLTRQTQALTLRVEECARAAEDAVRRKNRVSALAALRSKKLAEGNLATRHATLHQLEEVAAKMQRAADNAQLVRVMEASAGALRSLNGRVGGADRVDAVLEALREQMDEADEVGDVLAEGLGTRVDDMEVDDEFNAMLEQEKRKEDEEAERVKKEKEAKEAEETRRKLAELERLGPVSDAAPAPLLQEEEKENRPLTPVTATAVGLDHMSLDVSSSSSSKEKEPERKRAVLA
ncbi:Snf7-domain-containing protein [Xylariaceae sp. FL0594]|nr:Snf7-domain-containing protein [Xylariaceae sp. FL0594]